MKDLREYYNNEEMNSLTYLEFGAIDIKNSEKKVYDFRLHDDAYDFLMLARYMKDYIVFKNLMKSKDTILNKFRDYEKNVHTQDIYNTFNKLSILNVLKNKSDREEHKLIFTELGSTLFGAIEALEFIKKEGNELDPSFTNIDFSSDIHYVGIDISLLLNDVAKDIHKEYSIETLLNRADYTLNADIFFAKGVSILYAIDTVQELVDIFCKSKISNFDYSFSLVEPHKLVIGSGKNIQYHNIQNFIDEFKLKDKNKDLFIEESSIRIVDNDRRVRFNGYFGEKSLVKEVIIEEKRIKKIFYNALSKSDEARLINWEHKNDGFDVSYITSGEFMKKYT